MTESEDIFVDVYLDAEWRECCQKELSYLSNSKEVSKDIHIVSTLMLTAFALEPKRGIFEDVAELLVSRKEEGLAKYTLELANTLENLS